MISPVTPNWLSSSAKNSATVLKSACGEPVNVSIAVPASQLGRVRAAADADQSDVGAAVAAIVTDADGVADQRIGGRRNAE